MMKLSRALRVNPGEVIALVGAGGKTTAMFLLANELAPRMRVLATATTRLSYAQVESAPSHIAFDPAKETIGDLLPKLDRAIAAAGQALLTGPAEARSGKILGVAPQTIDSLAESGHFDVIIDEADGSRTLPLKAPAAHEPAIPNCATLVVPIAGLDAVGQPLGDAAVHRAELVGRVTDTALDEAITADAIARLLCHRDGGLKNAPAQARIVPMLNKVDADESRLDSARQIAEQLLRADRIESVVIGSMRRSDAPVAEIHSRIAAVVLAAGGSTRFGSPKQLARWRGKTFMEQAVDTALASSARPIVVVLGAEAERCRAAIDDRPVDIVVNQAWAEGQSTSMQAGLATLSASVGGAIFLLVDLPRVPPDLIDRLIQRHRETLAPVVWPEFEGQRGNPILFDRSVFHELRQVRGDVGGKPVLMRHERLGERVTVGDRSILEDFDRPGDLALAQMEQKIG